MSILNALAHLITLLLYSGHQFIHCMILLCLQYNEKWWCLFSGWFAKEANVANNKQRLANFMTVEVGRRLACRGSMEHQVCWGDGV